MGLSVFFKKSLTRPLILKYKKGAVTMSVLDKTFWRKIVHYPPPPTTDMHFSLYDSAYDGVDMDNGGMHIYVWHRDTECYEYGMRFPHVYAEDNGKAVLTPHLVKLYIKTGTKNGPNAKLIRPCPACVLSRAFPSIPKNLNITVVRMKFTPVKTTPQAPPAYPIRSPDPKPCLLLHLPNGGGTHWYMKGRDPNMWIKWRDMDPAEEGRYLPNRGIPGTEDNRKGYDGFSTDFWEGTFGGIAPSNFYSYAFYLDKYKKWQFLNPTDFTLNYKNGLLIYEDPRWGGFKMDL